MQTRAPRGGDRLLVKVATGVGTLDVIVKDHNDVDYRQLIDAKVAVRGIMGPRFNEERQLTGVHMFAQSLDQFQIREWGPSQPFDLPIQQINTVMRFAPGITPEHRIRIRGVVTANTGQLLSIAEDGHAMFVRAADASGINAGDLLDVVGFPTMGGYTPILEDITYRKIGRSELPRPLQLSANDLFSGRADASVVKARGVLLKRFRTLQEYRLLVGEGDRTFTALMPAANQDFTNALRDGSMLELTGTLQVEVNPNKTPKAIVILLRTPADVRFEALARWKHPVLGMIAPSKFISLAEETGLIYSLGRHVMVLACREAAGWPTPGGMPIQVAVNVSSLQFADPGFEEEIADVLQRTGLEPTRLQIELTESVMLNGSEAVAASIARLRAYGVSIAIDDFGTGYSCLGYLPKLPFTSLKLDRSFVRDLDVCAGSRAIVSSLVTLAENLGIKVIAEGIETTQQLETIQALGITEAQGFLLGRPNPHPGTVIREGCAAVHLS